MSKIRHRLTPSLVISCLALFIALSGTSYAVIVLPANSVGTKQIKKNAVKSTKIADNQVTGADVNEATLGMVPAAATANTANSANSANSANTANTANTASALGALNYAEGVGDITAVDDIAFDLATCAAGKAPTGGGYFGTAGPFVPLLEIPFDDTGDGNLDSWSVIAFNVADVSNTLVAVVNCAPAGSAVIAKGKAAMSLEELQAMAKRLKRAGFTLN